MSLATCTYRVWQQPAELTCGEARVVVVDFIQGPPTLRVPRRGVLALPRVAELVQSVLATGQGYARVRVGSSGVLLDDFEVFSEEGIELLGDLLPATRERAINAALRACPRVEVLPPPYEPVDVLGTLEVFEFGRSDR